MELLHKDLTEIIIRAFYEVYNELGYGFLEKVYENAFCYELELQGLKAVKQKPILVHYKNQHVGEYFSDILVNDIVILELKAVPLAKEHELQLLNYLKATDIEVGILFSFGKEPKYIRKIFQNQYK